MLDSEIREQIRRYLEGRIDAGDLEAWMSGEMEIGLEEESVEPSSLPIRRRGWCSSA